MHMHTVPKDFATITEPGKHVYAYSYIIETATITEPGCMLLTGMISCISVLGLPNQSFCLCLFANSVLACYWSASCSMQSTVFMFTMHICRIRTFRRQQHSPPCPVDHVSWDDGDNDGDDDDAGLGLCELFRFLVLKELGPARLH